MQPQSAQAGSPGQHKGSRQPEGGQASRLSTTGTTGTTGRLDGPEQSNPIRRQTVAAITSASVSTAPTICSSVCSAVTKNRTLAAVSRTAG